MNKLPDVLFFIIVLHVFLSLSLQIIHTDTGKVCGANDSSFQCDGSTSTFRVMFKEPVEIQPNTNYTACATLKVSYTIAVSNVNSIANELSLPPANEVRGKVIISQVLSVHRGRGVSLTHPPAQIPPLNRDLPGQRPSPDRNHPPPPDKGPPYVKERTVRILLECILVLDNYSSNV